MNHTIIPHTLRETSEYYNKPAAQVSVYLQRLTPYDCAFAASSDGNSIPHFEVLIDDRQLHFFLCFLFEKKTADENFERQNYYFYQRLTLLHFHAQQQNIIISE